jgi:hypothetical protein
MCALFSATYPQRTTALIMCGSFPRRIRAADYPFGLTKEEMQLRIAKMQREWGGPVGLAERAPSMVGDIRFSQWWGRMLRMAVSPAGIGALMAMNNEIDIRHILPAIELLRLMADTKNFKTNSEKLSELKVRVYGDTAVATYKDTYDILIMGEHRAHTIIATDTFAKMGDEWKQVASHGAEAK